MAALLDDLAEACGVNYLSDLRTSEARPALCGAVRELEAERYSLRDWKEALYYIAGQSGQGENVGAVRKALLDSLENTDQ